MSDKKHIDRIFQEGFKDFEESPSDAVWKNIEANLKEKKNNRRIIPIWWRYAGIAALLLLLITIGGVYYNNTEDSTHQVVESENSNSEKTNIDNNNQLNDVNETTPIVSDNNSEDNLNEDSNTPHTKTKDKLNPSKETLITESSVSKNQNKSKTKLASSDNSNVTNQIVKPRNKNVIAVAAEEKSNTIISQNKLENNGSIVNASENDNDNIITKNDSQLITKEKAKTIISEDSIDNSTIANANTDMVKKTKSNDNNDENKRSIEDAINNAKNAVIAEEEKLNNKWSIVANAAPVYFNTLSENGSSIDPQFNTNSKSGEVNMSYGVTASYALNKRLSVRSGINRVNLGYNTNDVVVFQSVGLRTSSSALRNVNSNSNGDDAVSLISAETLDASNAPESIASSNASINQALGYIEIPLEIQYTISNKKFGVNLIGGFSSFFLNNNEIFSEEENGNRTFLGEASNINKLSYSANLGLGLNYKVSNRFDLNLEPIFKYQFNTFNNTSGNFTPFFIGVYTGFAIKF